MKGLRHLVMVAFSLPPKAEWADDSATWRFLLVRSGAAYWLGPPESRALAGGECLVVPPGCRAVLRASLICEVTFLGFNFSPEVLHGFLTLDERRYFEAPAAA